jgi:beta-amylase
MVSSNSISACLLAISLGVSTASKVFVMLPLDTVTSDGKLKDANGLGSQLDQLKAANIDGFMSDVWWGVTEPSSGSYKFDAYHQLVGMAKNRGMAVQFVTSFHKCGGNVGDTCNIPVPSFVNGASGIWYKDQDGNENHEYISLFADNVTVAGRTPIQMYSDWLHAFASAFASDLGSTIVELQVGMGPAGELRYPAYPLAHWKFCGVGEFQVWDDHALSSFKTAAGAGGHPEWNSPPTDAGNYNSQPSDTSFFQGGYKSNYGKFFLDWYFSELKRHGAAVLTVARAATAGKVSIAGKIAGIHWWYNSPHHAAELTAGYYNTDNRDAYAEIAQVFADHEASIDFTCLEMADSEQPASCDSGPEELVRQVQGSAKKAGLEFNGENALPRYDDTAYNKILSYRNTPGGLSTFTYLRLGSTLLQGDNFGKFKNFVNEMHSGESLVV